MSIFGDIIGAVSAGDQASRSTKAINNAVAAQQQGFQGATAALNNGRDAALGYLQPYQSVGTNAASLYGGYLGITDPTTGSVAASNIPTRPDAVNIGAPSIPTQAGFNAPTFNFDPSTVNADSDPGLAYIRQQALGGVQQGGFAAGKGLSGATLSALSQRAGDIANQGWQAAYARDLGLATQRYGQDYTAASDAYARNTNYANTAYNQGYTSATDTYGRSNNQFTDYLNRLQGQTQSGQSAATTAGNVQTTTSSNGAKLFTDMANANANAILGKATVNNAASAAQTSYLNNGLNTAVSALSGGLPSDPASYAKLFFGG